MKKLSKKLLALLLAVVMIFGVVPNIFPAAEEVKASETTDTVDEFAGYDVEYNFVNADLSTMPELKSTQLLYANSLYTVIDGQLDRPITEHWFTGTSGYSTSTTNKNNGLKTKNSNNTTENGNKHSMITLMEDCENFEIQLQMHAGSNFGVAVGSKNVFPTGNNDGVRVYFANGRLQVLGKYNSYSTSGTQEHYINPSGNNKNFLLFNPKANSSNGLYSSGLPELTLNVSIYNGVLKVWVTGYDATLTVELADGYDRDVVSLIGNIYNGGGGFNSVKLSKYDSAYHFEGADLSKLPLTSTQLSNASPYGVISGQENKALSDHWFIGTSGYTTTTNIKNNGLKPKNNNSDANLKYSFIPVISGVKDFEMSLDMYASSDFGIAIGSKNVMPGGGTNTGAKIYFAGGYMRLVGTFDASSLKVTGTEYSYGWNNTPGKDLNFNPKSTTTGTNIYTNRQLETLNIKVQGNLLTLSMESCDTVLSIRLTDTSSMNTVSLYGRYYNGGGGFKSVGLRRSKTQYDFEKADLSLIDLKSTQLNNSSPYNVLEGQEDKSLADHWFTGTSGYTTTTNIKNNALKPKNNNSDANLKYSMIPIMSGAEDFELNLDIYASSDFGVTIGSKNVMPGAGTNTGVKIYFSGGYMRLVGTFDASSLNVTGTEYSYGWNNTPGKDLNFNPKSTTTGTNIYTNRQLETLNIRVQENVLTLWLDSSDTVLTIGLTDTSAMDTVSLFGRYYNGGGGFKGFKINPLQPAGGTKFDDLDLSTLAGWTSMIYDTAEKESVVADAITEQWFTGKTNYPSTENGWNVAWNSFKNSGLKPLAVNPSNQVTVLTSPDTYKNFESSFTYYQNSMAYGMVFGERGIYPQEVVDSAVRVYIQSTEYGKFLRVVGAVDSNSAVNTGTVEGEIISHRDYVEMKISNLGYAPAAASATATVTINVKVDNNQVTVSVEGIDAAMTVNLTGNYVYGPISLYATGCAHGGFKKLNVETLEDSTPVESTDVGFNVKVQGDYTAVSMSSEQAYSVINGDVKFDTSLYEYVVATFGTRSVMVNDNKFFTPAEDTLPIDILYNGDEEDKVVTLYFKNLSTTYDYSNMAFEDLQVIVSGGHTVSTVNQQITVVDDFTGDKNVNIADLIKGKKDGKTLTTLKRTLVGLADEEVSPLIGKSLLFLGDSIAKGAGDQYWMSWAARIGREGVLYDNQGQSGWTLTNTETSGQGQIATQLDKATRDEYDFVLLEGGVNDVRIFNGENKAGIKWGEINYDLDNTTYDTSSIVGAMQDLIVKTQQKFGNAKILYVINSYFGIEGDNVTNYRALVKDLCELHGIDYIDLSDLETYPELYVLTPDYENMQLEYLPDLLHPNAASYELTTPLVVEKMEDMLLEEKWRSCVYVDAVYGIDKGDGSKEAPYKTLNYAANQVSNGGQIVIVGDYTYGDVGNFGVKGKTITLTGDVLDLSSTTAFNITGPVVLKNLTVKANNSGSIFANGNSFTVEESVIFDGRLGHLYGGSDKTAQQSTYMVIKSGNYREIYGGGLQAKIEGDTYLFVGGNVNKGIDVFANEHKEATNYCIYGGSYSHIVGGNTKVVFDGKDAVAGYIYGGGRNKYAYVAGTSSVEMRDGTVYSIYGGVCEVSDYADRSTATEVKMYGGKVAQIFGGSGSSNLVGSTHVEIFGGNVTRRIYGGCYNDYSLTGWASTENHVIGTTNVILHDEATYGTDEDDNAICATSRWKNNLEEENATLTIETEALYNSLSGRLNVVMTNNKGYDALIVNGQAK